MALQLLLEQVLLVGGQASNRQRVRRILWGSFRQAQATGGEEGTHTVGACLPVDVLAVVGLRVKRSNLAYCGQPRQRLLE